MKITYLFYLLFSQISKALKNVRNALKLDMNQSFFLHLLALVLSSQKKVTAASITLSYQQPVSDYEQSSFSLRHGRAKTHASERKNCLSLGNVTCNYNRVYTGA